MASQSAVAYHFVYSSATKAIYLQVPVEVSLYSGEFALFSSIRFQKGE